MFTKPLALELSRLDLQTQELQITELQLIPITYFA